MFAAQKLTPNIYFSWQPQQPCASINYNSADPPTQKHRADELQYAWKSIQLRE